MSKNTADIATAYYTAIGEKNVEAVAKYIHPDIRFIAPLGREIGKEAFLEAARKFTALFKSLTIRSSIGSKDQAMVVYDLECPAPIGTFSTAAHMTFREGLIAKIELFFDARPFQQS